MKFIGKASEFLYLDTLDSRNCHHLGEDLENSLSVLWFQGGQSQLRIDGRLETFNTDEVLFLTEFHKVEPIKLEQIRFLRFNRPFYCIKDHDSEVGCRGLLFFGAATLPRIRITESDKETFDTLWKMFCIEMDSQDKLQVEMLQMMLKRYIILCTRLYKSQHEVIVNEEVDIVRAFNFLVETHFRSSMSVSDYAKLMNRAPKTLTNLFAKAGKPSPSQFIQERRMLEVRRLLRYSDKQIQEIAYEVGYGDIQAFSRFFKKHEGVSPKIYREAAL